MRHRTLVSPVTLAQHIENWAIVDCRFDLQDEAWGLGEYLAAHIPGAVYASLATDLSGAATGTNGRHPLPPPDRLAATFGRLGIDSTAQVVVYDQDLGTYAARLWWMLRYLGHEAVAVLDGGWARWTAEGLPVRAGMETRPSRAFSASPRKELVASLEEAKRASDTAGLLIDARAPERFEGRSESIDRAAGHIPGAINRFYKDNVTSDGSMQSAETLRSAYEQLLAARTPREAIMYCGSGVTACHNLLAMEHAGLPGARLYVGSWSEWSSDPDRPIETGPAKSHGN